MNVNESKRGGGGGGGGGRNKSRSNKGGKQQQQKPKSTAALVEEQVEINKKAELEGRVVEEDSNQNQIKEEDGGGGGGTGGLNKQEEISSSSGRVHNESEESSSSNDSGGTAIFNTADEGEVDAPPQNNNSNASLEEISSEEEDGGEGVVDEEGESVVNASLIVNLSNANISAVEDVSVVSPRRGKKIGVNEDTRGVVRDDGDHEVILVDDSFEVPLVDDDIMFIKEVVSQPAAAATPDPDVGNNGGNSREYSPRAGPSDGGGVVRNTPSPDTISSEESTLADSEVEKLMGGGAIRAQAHSNPSIVEGLPNTVTVLTAPNGVTVYLVGTAHFSQQSQVDVVNTIQATRPTLVLLELCSSRRNILSLDEETVLREVSEMNFQKIRLALSNSGTVQGTLHLLLLSMSAQLTKKLGMAPGGEFRAAMREARKLPGCVLLLGDRPFNITISRALAALSFTQKIRLAWQFLTSNEDITREEIEKCKEKDLLERMLSEMTGEFPSITEVFVNERDVYLAHSLYLAATSDAHRSNGGPIVGVVGMGHVPGIARNWGKTTDEDVNALVRIPETPLSTIIIRKTVKFGLYALVGVCVFKGARRLVVGSGLGSRVVAPGVEAIREFIYARRF